MKDVVESKRAWDLLLEYWNKRHEVTPETRCPKPLTYPDDRLDSQCVLHKDHLDGEKLQANVPHADADGYIAAIDISWETIRDAEYFRTHPIGEEKPE